MGRRSVLCVFLVAVGACGDDTEGSGATCASDLMTSGVDCGECGHSCWGGTCVAGECQAVPVTMILDVSSGPASTDGETVVWSPGSEVLTAKLHSYLDPVGRLGDDLVSGSPQALMAVIDGVIYWTDSQQMYRAPANASAPQEVVYVAPASEPFFGNLPFVAAGDELLWSPVSGPPYRLVACTAANCTATVHDVYMQQGQIRSLRSDGTYAAWVDTNTRTLRTCELASCAATVAVRAMDVDDPPGSFGPVFALQDGRLGWSNQTAVMQCSLPSCDATMAYQPSMHRIETMAIDAEGVYSLDPTPPSSVLSCAAAGCGGTPTRILGTYREGAFAHLRVTPEFFVYSTNAGVFKLAR